MDSVRLSNSAEPALPGTTYMVAAPLGPTKPPAHTISPVQPGVAPAFRLYVELAARVVVPIMSANTDAGNITARTTQALARSSFCMSIQLPIVILGGIIAKSRAGVKPC
jgi:hypothetical protein